MNTKRDTSSAINVMSARFRRRIGRAPLALLATLALALTLPARAETPPAAIPFSDIGARATVNYRGDALGVTATTDGAHLRCGFQRLEGHATPEGLWLESTSPGAAGRLRVTATALCRASSRARECTLTEPAVLELFAPTDVGGYTALASSGKLSVDDKLVRFTRSGVTEEYSVSVDGLRQDFIIESPPLNSQRSTLRSATEDGSTLNPSTGDLRVELALRGARAEATACGARLRLEGSGRTLAYSRLRVVDATGLELTARLEVLSADRLAVNVADTNATYPVRIDPIFSDADWVGLNPGILGADADVYAIAVDDSGRVYVGGGFTVIGTVVANQIAVWNGSAWSALGSGINGGVLALAVSGTNLYAGGYSTTAGGVPATNIAKWDGRAWSALGSGTDYIVFALAVNGTDLYAGGEFSTAGGVTATNIAKWNGSAWSALGSGMGGSYPYVCALAVIGTDLYAGGYFTTAGGVTANYIAKWNGSAWSALGSGMNGYVNALAVIGTNLYAGGYFTTAGGVTANYIAKWNGSAWSALGAGMNSDVLALAVSGTNLYAGGYFTTAGGVPANYIAKWDGSAWSALGLGVSSTVCALAVSGTNLYAGGAFSTVGGVAACNIAKWNGSAWSAMGLGMNQTVCALAMSGTNLYVGGYFTAVGGIAVNHVAKWDGNAWSALGSGINGGVLALAVSGTTLYAGGYFTTAGGVSANNIAKWDGSAWSALGSGMGGSYPYVNALAVIGTDLYAGGYFTPAGGVTANHIAKWNGSAWSALGAGVNDNVYALAVNGTNLYAGGSFTTAGGVTANGIAQWDGNAWSALGTEMGGVYALAVSGANLYAGGTFNAGWQFDNCVAKWDGRAWSALGPLLDITVHALAVNGTTLYAGGTIFPEGGVAATNIAKWDGSAWSALGSGVNNDVLALAIDGLGHLFVGGDFSLAGTNVSPYIAEAILVPSASTILMLAPTQTAEAGATVHLAVNAAGEPAPTYQWYLNGTNSLSCTSSNLVLTNILFSQSGTYTVVAINEAGAVNSAPVLLSVVAPVERRPVPGVRLTGASGSLLNVDYANALNSMPAWNPLGSVSLTSTSQYWFDLTLPLPPQRCYRAWQSETPGVRPSLHLHMVPGISLTGTVGSSLRVDYINRLGPIDAWVTLDTVTLTNTSQLYFDTSAPGQQERLYRLVPVA